MIEIQVTIPVEVLTDTVKILGRYQTHLELEAEVLPDDLTQVEDHCKLIEIVRRLLAYYAWQLGAWYKHEPEGGCDDQ